MPDATALVRSRAMMTAKVSTDHPSVLVRHTPWSAWLALLAMASATSEGGVARYRESARGICVADSGQSGVMAGGLGRRALLGSGSAHTARVGQGLRWTAG